MSESKRMQRDGFTNRWLFWGAWAVILGIGVYHARLYAWLCDDAFISFRYIRQWMLGHGLVFNPGEYVEGYTNFLWILELAAIWHWLGVRPENAVWALSGAVSAATLLLVIGLCRGSAVAGWWRLQAVMAGLLIVINAQFAKWSTSGLETRQFTLLVLLGVLLCAQGARRPVWLGLASIALALAELTRPEGLLVFGVCAGWWMLDSLYRGRFRWGHLLALAVPFALIVAAHYGLRYAYYGDWLPNTYYAKHVRPWPEMGLRYLTAYILETGVYVLAPLSLIGAVGRWAARGDGVFVLGWLLMGVHAGYVVWIGGDHFEYRPFDFYLPLLIASGVEGCLVLGQGVAHLLRRLAVKPSAVMIGTAALGWLAMAVFSTVLQVGTYLTSDHIGYYENRIHEPITRENFPIAYVLPGMDERIEMLNAAREECIQQYVGIRWREHMLLWQSYLEMWAPYEALHQQDLLPDGLVMAWGTVGILPYHLIDVTVIDTLGLTDRVIARNPVTTPNEERSMAHDREVPEGYLEERGVNFFVFPAARTLTEAFTRSHFALRIEDDLWMPFDSPDRDWLREAFAGRPYEEKFYYDNEAPEGNRLFYHGGYVRGYRFLGRFEDGLDGWSAQGEAMAFQPSRGAEGEFQTPVHGFVGEGLINTFHRTRGDQAMGRLVSPPFKAERDSVLGFLIGGGCGAETGVALKANGRVIQNWHGHQSEVPRQEFFDLGPYAGSTLQIEIFDNGAGAWRHVLADHFILCR